MTFLSKSSLPENYYSIASIGNSIYTYKKKYMIVKSIYTSIHSEFKVITKVKFVQ